jgi:hypothetical protein
MLSKISALLNEKRKYNSYSARSMNALLEEGNNCYENYRLDYFSRLQTKLKLKTCRNEMKEKNACLWVMDEASSFSIGWLNFVLFHHSKSWSLSNRLGNKLANY